MQHLGGDRLKIEQKRLLGAMLRVGRWKGTALAKAAGVAQTTVNRPLKADIPETEIKPNTLGKLFHAMDERVAEIDSEEGFEPGKGPSSQQWQKVQTWWAAQVLDLPHIEVIGAVQAGAWVESIEWPEEDRYSVAMSPDPRWPGVRRYGLEVRGSSMDRLWPAGRVVICISLIHSGYEPDDGDFVVVERRRPHGLIEATVKELRIEEDGSRWLVPHSHDPRHQAPIPLDGRDGEEEIKISGLVVGDAGTMPTAAERKASRGQSRNHPEAAE